jgi:hypothetical protein
MMPQGSASKLRSVESRQPSVSVPSMRRHGWESPRSGGNERFQSKANARNKARAHEREITPCVGWIQITSGDEPVPLRFPDAHVPAPPEARLAGPARYRQLRCQPLWMTVTARAVSSRRPCRFGGAKAVPWRVAASRSGPHQWEASSHGAERWQPAVLMLTACVSPWIPLVPYDGERGVPQLTHHHCEAAHYALKCHPTLKDEHSRRPNSRSALASSLCARFFGAFIGTLLR